MNAIAQVQRHSIPAAVISNAKANIADTIGKYVDLQQKGAEYVTCCPFHKEKTPSFTVKPEKEFFYCFGCGASGDAVDFVMEYENIGFPQAVERIVGKMTPQAAQAATQRASAKPIEAPEWTPIVPVPAGITLQPKDIFNRPKGNNEWERLVASRRWAYRDAAGQLIGYISRFELPGGGKDVMPQSFCVNSITGEMGWRWLSFAKPRPLYGLDKLAAHPAAQVMLVEGEKACDAAQDRYEAAGVSRDKLITLSWPGGGKAVKHTDWVPLHGRNVGLWPDADQKDYGEGHQLEGQRIPVAEQPGVSCMLSIAELLADKAKSLKIIEPPAGVPDGWDLADDLPEGFSLLGHSRSASMLVADFVAKHPKPEQAEPARLVRVVAGQVVEDLEAALRQVEDIEAEPLNEPLLPSSTSNLKPTPEQLPSVSGGPVGDKSVGADDQPDFDKHFAILGFDRGTIFVYSHRRGQILTTSAASLSKASGLLEFAPLNWWELFFQKAGKGGMGLDAVAAADWVVREAEKRGIYDASRVRGRGVWVDQDRLVFHHGDFLTVDGTAAALSGIRSRYVYEAAAAVAPAADTLLTAAEGAALTETACRFRWAHSGSGMLLAGWAFLAPVCGALDWRSHIWVTGAAGSGKSTLLDKFLAKLMPSEWLLSLQGSSTEAGVRQRLKSDARPVLIDEFECNTEADVKRIESILTLIRQSSSETGAEVARGTISGHAMSFRIRSAFCLASVGVSLSRQTDEDRLTRLELAAEALGDWGTLERELKVIAADHTYGQRMFARALKMLPVIRESAAVISRVAGKHFGRQRDGDQFGTLLAGAWCLQKDHAPSEAEALVLIKGQDWASLGAGASVQVNDSRQALDAILSSPVRVDQRTFSVAQLIDVAAGGAMAVTGSQPAFEQAVHVLGLHGIRISEGEDPRRLLFAMARRELVKLVEGTSFETDLIGRLARLPGAWKSKVKKPGEAGPPEKTRFAGATSRYVSIPLSLCSSVEDAAATGDDHPF